MTERELKRIIFDSYVKGKVDTITVISEFLQDLLKSIHRDSNEMFDKTFPEIKNEIK